jgi:NAD+ synthase
MLPSNLALDPAATCEQIEAHLRYSLDHLQKDGIVLGLSGGLDSAVAAYLCARSTGAERITFLNLPDRDSKAIHQQHARLIADQLGIQLITQEITPIMKQMGVYDLLPFKFLPGQALKEILVRFGKRFSGKERIEDIIQMRFKPQAKSLVARGNAYASSKHRTRMVMLYQYADVHNLMVVGAANKTEWMTGTFSMWGCDHCADVMPILHLYRSQLIPLAEYLNIPEEIRTKNADPDILPGINDKEAFLGSFLEADQILRGLEQGISREELIQKHDPAWVERIINLHSLSAPMRQAPICL